MTTETLRAALEPFANYATALLSRRSKFQPDSELVFGIDGAHVSLGDLRRARNLLYATATLAQPPADAEVEGIRDLCKRLDDGAGEPSELPEVAAATIRPQAAEIEALRKALEPFAILADDADKMEAAGLEYSATRAKLVYYCRAARAALGVG